MSCGSVHRIVLANESRLLRGMLHRVINRRSALQIVGEVTDLAQLLSTVDRTDAHWVIVSLSPEGDMPRETVSELGHTPVGILGMTTDGTRIKVKQVASVEKDLGSLSLEELITLLETSGSHGVD